MDPYSLLSSSTRISGPSKEQQSSQQNAQPSRKRKRGLPQLEETISVEKRSNGPISAVTENLKAQSDDRKPARKVLGPSRASSSYDERRAALKRHKIKVANLWTPSSRQSSSRKRKNDSHNSSNHKEALAPEPLTDFDRLSEYGVPTVLLRNLEEQGFSVPSDVQLASLPLLLDRSSRDEGRSVSEGVQCHLLSVAPTGSGKTLAFLIPAIQMILRQRKHTDSESKLEEEHREHGGPSVLILAPTKELAKQIVNEARKLAHMTGIRATLISKGLDLFGSDGEEATDDAQVHAVRSNMLVSTPQAFINASKQADGEQASFPSIKMLILDEADVLLDPLFRDQTMSVWSACRNPKLQLLLWSATMGSNIEDISRTMISTREPQSRLPLHRLVVGLKDSSIPNIEHRLAYAASEQGKLMALRQLLHSTTTSPELPQVSPPFLVFTQTIPRAVALHAELLYDIPTEAGGSARIAVLHADLSDTARDRIMTQFRSGAIWILITTDLLARGVDFHGINAVINYDLPNSSAAYVHRVGRTGRAGRAGVSITLYSEDDLPYVKNVANVIAASERTGKAGLEGDSKWILNNLPKVSKRDKERLKKRGVESRRQGKPQEAGKAAVRKSQISTKSAFERREENKRRGAVVASRRKQAELHSKESVAAIDATEEPFTGFEN